MTKPQHITALLNYIEQHGDHNVRGAVRELRGLIGAKQCS